MLVLVLPRVSSGISGFPVASPCRSCETSFQLWKLAEVSHEMLVLVLPPVSFRVSGFLAASPCLWGKHGEATKSLLFKGFQAACHVVLRGRRGTLWHSNLFDNVSKMSKLEAVSHEILVFLRPPVSSRVSGFPVASPCLWGKLHAVHFTLHTPHSTL